MRGLALVLAMSAVTAGAQEVTPKSGGTGVNPDTHLIVAFAGSVKVGTSGKVRVADAVSGAVVDTIDMSLPAGPDPAKRVPLPPDAIDPHPATPTTTTPAVRTTPGDLHSYQLNTIGGLDSFHFRPVLVNGNVATIALHNGVLRYGHRYTVTIEPGVLLPESGEFRASWSFRTKSHAPAANAARVVVAADGSGDFNTVQGAVDWAPARPGKRVEIFLRDGRYEEIVFARGKHDLTFRGEDRDKVWVGYGNNSAFNPPMPGPSRRCAFSLYESEGIVLENFTIANTLRGQAEALLVFGARNTVRRMNLTGSGDALNLRGSVYFVDSRIQGDGDSILGVGPAFFERCEISSAGPFMWIRNTAENHGNVFLECTFVARLMPNRPESSAVLARLPVNHGLNYPDAEAVLIRCVLKGLPAAGWGPVEGDTSRMKLWEFDSRDAEGKPVDVSARHEASRQLHEPADAKLIAEYSDPAFVLGGWNPR